MCIKSRHISYDSSTIKHILDQGKYISNYHILSINLYTLSGTVHVPLMKDLNIRYFFVTSVKECQFGEKKSLSTQSWLTTGLNEFLALKIIWSVDWGGAFKHVSTSSCVYMYPVKFVKGPVKA